MSGFFAQAPLWHFKGDFWKFWSGQTISSLGSSVTGFVLPLLVFKLTNSPLNLALTMVFTVLPYLLFGLAIGAWVDRTNRKRVMIGTDCARALVIASLPLLRVLGLLSVWWIYVVSFVNATLTIGFTAANFAAIPSLVEPDDLVAANGYIQASFSMASIIGPLVAGQLLIRVPLPLLLLIDATSFLVSTVSLLLVKRSFNASASEKKVSAGIGNAILEGLHYVLHSPILFWLTLLLLLFNFILPTADIQIVLYAKQWLRASDTQIGLLYASDGIGVVAFSLLTNRLRKRWSFGVVALGSMMVLGLLTALMAFTHWYPSVLVIWALHGGTDVLFLISAYSMTQLIVPNALLGRVITFTRVLTWPTGSLGALLGGLVIAQTGNVGFVYGCVGLLVFLVAFAFWFTAYLPDPSIIICPGGGFHFYSLDNEGTDVARWFTTQGVAAFVLKYRLIPTPAQNQDFLQLVPYVVLRSGFPLDKEKQDMIAEQKKAHVPLATMDGKQALKVVRERAATLGIDPQRVGILGFSAGGIIAVSTALARHETDSRPNFAASIYSPFWLDLTVPATTLAINEAGHLRQEKIAPEHLLLGLTQEGEGIAVGLMRALGTTLEKVRAQTFQAIALASGGKTVEAEQSPPKSNVVTCRIDGRDLDAVDALIEAGIRSTRSDAAAWLIHAGIEANRPLFEKVYGTVAEIRRLRVVAQSLAQEVAGNGEGSTESTEEQSQ